MWLTDLTEVSFAHEGPDAPWLLIQSTSSSTLVSSSLSKWVSALCVKSCFIVCVSLYVLSRASHLSAWPSIPSLSCSPSSVPACFCLSLVYIKPFVCFCVFPGEFLEFPIQLVSQCIWECHKKNKNKPRAIDVDVVYLDPPQPSADGPHLPKPSSNKRWERLFALQFYSRLSCKYLFAWHSCLTHLRHYLSIIEPSRYLLVSLEFLREQVCLILFWLCFVY